jgi:DNA-binding transcriptional LysR family regulator
MDRLAGLQLFVRIVETGSFSKAARELNVTQPTATKHVAAIEQRFQVRLLNRNPRAISLTESGAIYYDKCKVVLRHFEESEAFRGLQQAEIQGSLRIGTSLTFGRQIVSPLLIEFMRLHPHLRVDVSHDDRYVDLIAQGIDVAIRLGNLADSSLGGRYLGVNPWVMVASPAYLAQRGIPTTHTELPNHDCLIYTSVQGDDFWHMRTPSGERVSVLLNGRVHSNSLSTLLDAARADMGITVLPYYVAAEFIAAGQLQELMPDHALPDQEIHAVYASPKLVPTKVTALIAFLKERFQPNWWLARGRADLPNISE